MLFLYSESGIKGAFRQLDIDTKDFMRLLKTEAQKGFSAADATRNKGTLKTKAPCFAFGEFHEADRKASKFVRADWVALDFDQEAKIAPVESFLKSMGVEHIIKTSFSHAIKRREGRDLFHVYLPLNAPLSYEKKRGEESNFKALKAALAKRIQDATGITADPKAMLDNQALIVSYTIAGVAPVIIHNEGEPLNASELIQEGRALVARRAPSAPRSQPREIDNADLERLVFFDVADRVTLNADYGSYQKLLTDLASNVRLGRITEGEAHQVAWEHLRRMGRADKSGALGDWGTPERKLRGFDGSTSGLMFHALYKEQGGDLRAIQREHMAKIAERYHKHGGLVVSDKPINQREAAPAQPTPAPKPKPKAKAYAEGIRAILIGDPTPREGRKALKALLGNKQYIADSKASLDLADAVEDLFLSDGAPFIAVKEGLRKGALVLGLDGIWLGLSHAITWLFVELSQRLNYIKINAKGEETPARWREHGGQKTLAEGLIAAGVIDDPDRIMNRQADGLAFSCGTFFEYGGGLGMPDTRPITGEDCIYSGKDSSVGALCKRRWRGADYDRAFVEMFLERFDAVEDGETVLKFIGAAICGDATKHKKTLWLHDGHGRGNTGKSQTVAYIARVCAGISTSVSIFDLQAESGYLLNEKMHGLVHLSGDASNEPLKKMGAVKAYTGGDIMRERAIYSAPVTFRPRGLWITQSNHAPDVQTADAASLERFLLVQVNKDARKRRDRIAEALALWGEEVFDHILAGAVDLYVRDLAEHGEIKPSARCLEVTALWLRDSNALYRAIQTLHADYYAHVNNPSNVGPCFSVSAIRKDLAEHIGPRNTPSLEVLKSAAAREPRFKAKQVGGDVMIDLSWIELPKPRSLSYSF